MTAAFALVLLLLLGGCGAPPPPRDRVVAGGEASRGVDALRRYGCGGCHVVPGLPETRGAAGPPLEGLAERTYIAGRLTNRPINLVLWIRAPRSVDAGTLMPDLGVGEQDAKDIAAYLYRTSE
jgi:cytochrome c1